MDSLIGSFVEVTEELVEGLLENVEEVYTEELSARPDAKAVVAVEAIAKILSPIVPEIAEWIAEASCEEKEKLRRNSRSFRGR